ncbi:MAG TPA: RNA polymerase sigma factor [Phenylobacterium sp.]|nr:RNA polymerase sigma factor [Phenylobacterium sp.]
MDESADDPLLATYLERREELVGYFRVRLRSEEAARDLVQDIYLKIMGRPPEDVGNPAAYLYRVGTNLMLDQIKQRRRAGKRDADWRDSQITSAGGEDIAAETPADEAMAARQRLQQIVAVVNELPPPAREAFRLHKLEGLSHAETAAAMGVSRSSIEKYMMLALKSILSRVGRGPS